jgi:NAD(P)-dependent dehydrogenase (short-subunit alcohol dehydrogenase family)
MSFEPLDNLNGQTAIIAGSMGGVGYATARRLADRGARIVGLVRRNVEDAQEKLDQLPNDHLKHLAILADVTVKDQLTAARDQIDQCDILVNASGNSVFIPQFRLDLLSDKIFDAMLTDNLRSQFSIIRTFLPLIKKSPTGLIVNLGSTAGAGVGGSNIAYAAAKAGIDSMTRNLSMAILPTRIINVVFTGVETDFIKNRPDNFYELEKEQNPMGRCPTVDDIANTIEAYATVIRFTTGVSVVVDGGKSLHRGQPKARQHGT